MGPGTVSKPSPESQAAAEHLAALRAAEEARRRAEEAARRAAEEARRKAEEARRQAEAARREAEQAKKAAADAARAEKKDDKELQQLRDAAQAKETEALKKEAKASLAEKEKLLLDSKLQDAQQGRNPTAPSEGTQAAEKEVGLAKKVVALYEAPEQKGDQALDGASARTKDLQTKAQEAAKPAFDALMRGEQPTKEQEDKANKAIGEWLDAAQQEMRTAGVTAQAKGGDVNTAIDEQAAAIRKRLEDGGVFDPKAFDESLNAAKSEVKGESPAARQLRMEQYDSRKTAQADYDKARQDAKTADEKADAAEAYAKNFKSASTDSQVTARENARAEAKRLRQEADDAQAKADRLKLQGDATDSQYESDIADIKVRDAQAGYAKAKASGDKDAIAKAEKLLDGAIDEQTLAHDLRDDASAKLKLFDAKGNLADATAAWEAEKGNQPQLKEVEYNHRGTKTTRTITPDGYDKTFWATPGTDAGKNVQKIDGKWYYVTSGPRGTQSKQELNPVTAQLWEAHVGVNGEQKDGKTVGGAQLAADQAQAKLKLTLEDMFGTGDGQTPGRLDSQAWLGAEGDINKKLTDANDGVTAAQSALTAARRYGASADTIAELEADLGGKLQLQRQAQGMADALKAIKELRQAQRDLVEIQNPGSASRCPTMTEAQAQQRVNDLRDKARTAVANALKPPEFSPEQVKAARTRLGDNQKLLKTQEQTVETARTEWQNAKGDDKVKKDQTYQAALDKYDQLKLAVDNDASLVKQADTRYRADAAQNQYDNFGFVKPNEGYTRGGYNFAANLEDQPAGFDPTYDVKPPSNYDELLRTAKKEDDGTRVLSDGTKIKPDGTWELKDGTQIEHKDGKYYVSFKTYVAAGRAGMVASRSDKFEMHGVTAKLWDTKRLAYEADVGRTKFLDDLKLKGQTLPPAEPPPPVLGLDGKPRPTLLLTDDLAKRKPQVDKALTDATDARKLAQQNYDQGTGDRTELKTKLDEAIALEDIARKEQAAVDAVLLWQSSNRERQEYDANKRAGRPDAMCYAKPPGEKADDQRDLALKAITDWQGARDKLHTDRAQRTVDTAQAAHDTWKRENPWLAGSEKSSDTWKALQQAKGDYDLVKRGQAANAGARADEQAFISHNLKPGEHNDPQALYRLFDSNPQVMAQSVINDHYVQYGGEAITMQGRTHLGNLVSQALGWQPSVELDPNSPAYNQQLTKTQDLYGNLVKEQKELRGNVVDKIIELGGDDAKVTVLPVVYGLDEKNGGIVKTAIFKVEGDNGQVKYVDEQGWEYKSLDDYRANNSLPVEDVKLVMPEDGKFTLDDKGNVKLLVADARTETGWETFRRVSKIDYVVAGVGLVAGVVLTVGSMGTLSVPGAAIAVASVSLVAAGTYGVVTSAQSLQRQADHGQSVNPFTNAQARMDWLNLGLSALSVPVVGASGRATMLALRSKAAFDRVGDVADVTRLTAQQAADLQQGVAYAQRAAAWGKPAQAAAKPLAVGSGVAMEEGVRQLIQNWDNMSPSERNQQIAMLGLNAAGFASPVFAKGYVQAHNSVKGAFRDAPASTSATAPVSRPIANGAMGEPEAVPALAARGRDDFSLPTDTLPSGKPGQLPAGKPSDTPDPLAPLRERPSWWKQAPEGTSSIKVVKPAALDEGSRIVLSDLNTTSLKRTTDHGRPPNDRPSSRRLAGEGTVRAISAHRDLRNPHARVHTDQIAGANQPGAAVRSPSRRSRQEEVTLAARARDSNDAAPSEPGWFDDTLLRAALHPAMRKELLHVMREEAPQATPQQHLEAVETLYGTPQSVRMTSTHMPELFQRQVLAAWRRLEHAGTPVEINGWTPLVTPRPQTYQIRPSRPPQLDTVADFANSLRGVTPQSTRIARALDNGDIEFNLLSAPEFQRARSTQDTDVPLAFARGHRIFLNRDSDPWALLLDAVHEGTHALDHLTQLDIGRPYQIRVGDKVVDSGVHQRGSEVFGGDLEARAYYHQIEFARALGLSSEGHEGFPTLVGPHQINAAHSMQQVHGHIQAGYPDATNLHFRPAADPYHPPLQYQRTLRMPGASRVAFERPRATGTHGEGAKPWRITHGDEHAMARSVNPTRSDTNCINSAVTLDRMMSSPGTLLQAVPSGAKTLAQVFALYGDAPTAAFGNSGDALAHVATLPEGSRGFVTMGGGDGADLHIVNFVRRGDDVDVIDAQAGRHVRSFDAADVHVIVTHQGGRPPVDMTVMSGPQLRRFLATSPHDAPAQGPQGWVSGLPSNAGKPGFDAQGDALQPTSFGRRRSTWDDVARGADGYIHRQQLAAQPGSKVPPLKTSADEAAVLKSLTDEPEINSRVKFVVSNVGPHDTIFSGAGVKGRKLYETYAAAAKAAQENGGGWVHRLVPDAAKGLPRRRQQFDSSEIVGAVHVGRDGTQLPIGIPNTRHGTELGRSTEVAATWKEAVKGVLTHTPTHRRTGEKKQIRAKVFTYGAAGARIAAESVAPFLPWPAAALKHPGASYATQPLSSFGRGAYLTASQRSKEAYAAATTGNLGLAEKLIGKVTRGSGWRGDNLMERSKIDELYTSIWKVQEVAETFRQKLGAMGDDAPSASRFRLDTIQHPDEVALAPKRYLDEPGVGDFIQLVRFRQRDGMFGQKTRVVRQELLRRLSNMDRSELARAADPASKDNSPEARLLRRFPQVRKAFERRVDERQDLRRAHGDLYKALLEVAADPEKPGYVSAQAAEGNAGSTNAPSSRLGLTSRRATLVASTNVFVGWFFKPMRISSVTTGVAHFADLLAGGSLWANYKYNIKVDHLDNVKAKLKAAMKASGLDEKQTRAADPDLDKELTNAQIDKDKWNKWRDFFGLASAGRAVAVGVGLQEAGLPLLGYASYTQAGLTVAWVGLQQIPALRNGAAPTATKILKWSAVGAIALVPVAPAVYNAFFAPKKDDNAKNLVEWTVWGLKQAASGVKDWLQQPADQMPVPGPANSPSATQSPSVTTAPTVRPSPSATTPGTGDKPPGRDPHPPVFKPIYVTVDGSDPKTGTLRGIAENNAATLLAGPELDKARQEGGRNRVANEALSQLFNLNPRFDKRLMDGVVSNVAGDPDTLMEGWKVKVGETRVSG
ncbi:DUF4781 domain-containing protein [Methylibium rhizosphaerae]|uniref:DUF4781 domain-containing protein n=1 Tax=Methylibium rhizosphaerae TaxID=2570323 RepID=UPI00112803EE|nr:DUF4781 domain-containing protein [Methylibium rhizosphaerae]